MEAVLDRAPGVTRAAARAWKHPSGRYRLVGYVCPAGSDIAAVMEHCRANLLPGGWY